MDGSIEIIIGPMFCGKSTELIRRIRRYEVGKFKCLCIKYEKDVRYEELTASGRHIKTHDQEAYPAITTMTLHDVMDVATTYDVIGIDEAQFFNDLVDFCEQLSNKGKKVVVAGLDGDFLRRSFGRICELIPLAEDVIKLKAICIDCNKDASFTKRLVDNQDLELIGGAKIYKPTCRSCHGKK